MEYCSMFSISSQRSSKLLRHSRPPRSHRRRLYPRCLPLSKLLFQRQRTSKPIILVLDRLHLYPDRRLILRFRYPPSQRSEWMGWLAMAFCLGRFTDSAHRPFVLVLFASIAYADSILL